MKAVLLAAGKGERLGVVTQSLPKPMFALNGKPILQWNVELCRRHGITDLYINLHHLPEIITDHFGNGSRFGVSIHYTHEPVLLGTAGGVKQFHQYFGNEDVLVIYADNFFDYDLNALYCHHQQAKADMTIALFHLDDVRLSGVAVMDCEGWIQEFVEKPQGEPPSHWVNAGLYVLSPFMFAEIPDGFCDFGREVIPNMLSSGRKVAGMIFDHKVIAIDTPELLQKVLSSNGGG